MSLHRNYMKPRELHRQNTFLLSGFCEVTQIPVQKNRNADTKQRIFVVGQQFSMKNLGIAADLKLMMSQMWCFAEETIIILGYIKMIVP